MVHKESLLHLKFLLLLVILMHSSQSWGGRVENDPMDRHTWPLLIFKSQSKSFVPLEKSIAH